MKDHKLNQLFSAAGKDIPPTPPEEFDVCVVRLAGLKPPAGYISLWEQLEMLFPRVALASLLLAGVCVLGDLAGTSPELSRDLDNLSMQWLFASTPV